MNKSYQRNVSTNLSYTSMIALKNLFFTECTGEASWKVIESFSFYIESYRKSRKEEKSVKYDAFFRRFYIEGNDGCLKGHFTTWEIPKFFAEMILPDDGSRDKLPEGPSYDKWFQEGGSSPRNHWKNFARHYNEESFVSSLLDTVEEDNLSILLSNFGVSIPEGEEINKELLCRAIAQQFKTIIEGKGEAKDVVADIYRSGNIKADFMDYIKKSVKRYNTMKLIGGDEVSLTDFFVCNTIGVRERVFAEKKKINGEYLGNPDLTQIKEIFKKRPSSPDNLRTILMGSGGCGKSLMLQHLFLKAAEDYKFTGILPIFVELRNFKHSDNLKSFIINSVHSKDKKFNEEIANSLFLSGRCQLLLDGFDEIDPNEIPVFLPELDEFCVEYENIQIIITSRNNEFLTGLHGFNKLYVWPFNTEQSYKLIDKILSYSHRMDSRDAVIKYINDGFLKKDGVFASHPLLLSFVTLKLPEIDKLYDNRILFYKLTYEALLSGHDDNKKPYARVFMSVDNSDQFSDVFKQFCAYTYRAGVLKVNTEEFEYFFNMLTVHKSFENPHKMNLKNFKHDVCSTACIMYEEAYDLFYIDPGFQEYLFAEYYKNAAVSEVQVLQQELQKVPYKSLSKFDALNMFYKSAEVKFDMYVIKPYLDVIFKDEDEEAFLRFLQNGFDEVSFANINEQVTNTYYKIISAKQIYLPTVENYPKSILLNYVLDTIGIPYDYDFSLYSKYNAKLPDDVTEKGKLIGQENLLKGNKILLIDAKPNDVVKYFNSVSLKGQDNGFFIGTDKLLVDFGSRMSIDSFFLCSEPEKYRELVKDIIKNSKKTYEVFLKIKDYYKQLKIKLFKSGLK